MKEAYAQINLDAILYNYRHLKCQYHKNIIAVIKDDAYGVGAVFVANKLKNEEGIIFAVKNFDEAIKLRNANILNEILVLGVFEQEDIITAKEYRLSVIVTHLNQLEWLKNQNIPFHLKIDTGMNRLGLSIMEYNQAILEVYQNKSYLLKGIMTHFATADEDHQQYDLFCQCLENIDTSNLIIHCFSSNSIRDENKTNYARIGMKLYGFLERSAMLKNAVEVFSPIVFKQKVQKGENVGYDFIYKAKEDGYLYVLPIGYANGWGRFNKSLAYLPLHRLEQAGNISMDYSVYFSKEDIKKDMIVELIGLNAPLEKLAQWNHISMYEILSKLKLKHIYL